LLKDSGQKGENEGNPVLEIIMERGFISPFVPSRDVIFLYGGYKNGYNKNKIPKEGYLISIL
jgi:hypothetical protein